MEKKKVKMLQTNSLKPKDIFASAIFALSRKAENIDT